MERNNNRALIAHLAMFGACAGWGLMAPVGKDAMSNGIDGITMVSFRVAGACLLFWIASLVAPKEHVPLKDKLMFIGAAVFGLILNQCCYTIGLRHHRTESHITHQCQHRHHFDAYFRHVALGFDTEGAHHWQESAGCDDGLFRCSDADTYLSHPCRRQGGRHPWRPALSVCPVLVRALSVALQSIDTPLQRIYN